MNEETPTQPEEDTKPQEQEEAPEEEKAEDVNDATETEEKAPAAEETIGDSLPASEKTKKGGKPDTIPFDVFENMKKELKEEIRSLKDDKDTKESVVGDLDLKDLSSKHDVSQEFLADFAQAIEGKAISKFEDRFKGIEAKEAAAEFDKKFATLLDNALEISPDYSDIINADVIKTLAQKPENQDKTVSKLIEETYGKAVTGRRSAETTTPGGGQEPQKLDLNKAQTDPAYFKEVMADPTLKKEYNEGLEKRINF
jgi:hypothetical protein